MRFASLQASREVPWNASAILLPRNLGDIASRLPWRARAYARLGQRWLEPSRSDLPLPANGPSKKEIPRRPVAVARQGQAISRVCADASAAWIRYFSRTPSLHDSLPGGRMVSPARLVVNQAGASYTNKLPFFRRTHESGGDGGSWIFRVASVRPSDCRGLGCAGSRQPCHRS